jgi:hypothetical protein
MMRSLAFQAPAGWIHVLGPNNSDNWMHPPYKDFIMARELPALATPADRKDEKPIQICGGHVAYTGSGAFNRDEMGEWVDVEWRGKRYMAVYVRPNRYAPNREAEAAIRTLCMR